MTTYLLSWVASEWPVRELQKLLVDFERSGELVHRWSCSRTRKIRRGDRIFLIEKGREGGGLFGSGHVLSDKPIEGLHFNEDRAVKGDTSYYVEVKFDMLVQPSAPIVSRKELEGKRLDCNTWTLRGSGKTISEEIALALEEIWSAKAINFVGELEELVLDTSLSDTERQALINARRGQGQFRNDVISVWGGREQCVVTLATTSAMLTASHVRAWRKCTTKDQRLDGANGLLLCAHIDRLFDRHLVSFEPMVDKLICRVGNLPADEKKQLAKLGFSETNDPIRFKDMGVKPSNYEAICSYMSDHFRTFSGLKTFTS